MRREVKERLWVMLFTAGVVFYTVFLIFVPLLGFSFRAEFSMKEVYWWSLVLGITLCIAWILLFAEVFGEQEEEV